MRGSARLIPLWLRHGSAVLMVSALALVSVSAARETPRTSTLPSLLVGPIVSSPIRNENKKPPELLPDLLPSLTRTLPRLVPQNIPRSRTVWMQVTAYCPCPKCCGPKATGRTASGKHVSYNSGRFVAADTKQLPFGTKVLVPGYHDNEPVEVIDRGGAIKGDKLDVFFPNHADAKKWGRKWVAVTILG